VESARPAPQAARVLNVSGFYDRLAGFLDHAVEMRFLRPQQRAVLAVEAEPQALLARLANAEPPATWLRDAAR
jgi:hypothetical protein